MIILELNLKNLFICYSSLNKKTKNEIIIKKFLINIFFLLISLSYF